MGAMISGVVAAIASVIVVLILYLVIWPVKIDPVAWTPPQAPPASGVYAVNHRLSGVEKLAQGHVGPESVAINSSGHLFTGLHDGRILRISADGKAIGTLTTAAEPLGMKSDADRNLIVADARLGLISVDSAGNKTVLTYEVAGSPHPFRE